jgi:hypothetical protein
MIPIKKHMNLVEAAGHGSIRCESLVCEHFRSETEATSATGEASSRPDLKARPRRLRNTMSTTTKTVLTKGSDHRT